MGLESRGGELDVGVIDRGATVVDEDNDGGAMPINEES
jgi:hypothetical protein